MEKKQTDKTTRKPKLLNFLIGPILTLHIFSFVSTALILAQYGYYFIHKIRYPQDNATTQSQFTCETNTSTLRYEHQVFVQQETSTWTLYMTIANGAPGIILTLFYGTYSDKFGRKTFLLVPLVGIFIRTCLFCLGIFFQWDIYLFILFALIEGFSASQAGPVTIGYAIAADLTSEGKIRTFAIALVELSAGVGVLVGMVSSGYLIQSLGYVHPFIIAAVLQLINILLIIFVLPETKKTTKETESVPMTTYIKNTFSFYYKKDKTEIDKRKTYILCIVIFFFACMANLGRIHVDILYELNAPFCWNAIQVGVFGMLRTATMNLIGLPSIRLLQICLSDESIAIIGSVSGSLSMLLEGLAPNSVALYLVILVGIGGVLPLPVMRGIMSRMTPSDKQGSLQSSIGSVSSLCNVLGTLSANGIYSGTVSQYRGIVYFVMAVYYTVSTMLILILKFKPTCLRTDNYVLEQHIEKDSKVVSTKIMNT